MNEWKKTPWKKIDVENMDVECKKFSKEIRGEKKTSKVSYLVT
jgi:dynein heavy chain